MSSTEPAKPFWQNSVFVLALATIIILLSYGSRQSFGMFMLPVSVDLNWGREVFSFAVAIQNLIYGLAAPAIGAMADRWGPVRVLLMSAVLYCTGLFMMSQSVTPEGMMLSVGLFTGVGAAGCALPMLLSIVGRTAPPEKQSLYFGIVTSGGTAGQMLIIPLSQGLIANLGWVAAAGIMAVMVSLILPLTGIISSAAGDSLKKGTHESLTEVVMKAKGHSGFILLMIGFFVCGFQIQFIVAHMPAYLSTSELGVSMASVSLALIGFFNMLGTWTAGWAGGRYRKKNLLSLIYLSRSLVIMAFVLLPLTSISVIVFSAMVGFLWLATVPLTSGIVVQIFGPRYLATLYGFVFLSHQLGSFAGVWMGGLIYDQNQSYDTAWWAIVIAGVLAALIHWPIKDDPLESAAPAPAE
ncbi:MAG: MFS transporter [Rhodospirillaceae bacterium]|jgi:predicted MFS family arabinose efflux permease|nr:MFS transporter [Rhodospirillaceae bacterium]